MAENRQLHPLNRRARVSIYAAVFLAFLDNFVLLPVIAPRAAELGGSSVGVGMAIAAYSLANLVFNLLGGFLADRFGRRRIVVWALVASPLAIGSYAWADSIGYFLAARLFHGASGGVLATSLLAMLGDASKVGTRGKVLGQAGAIIGLAALLGPVAMAAIIMVAGLPAIFMGLAAVLALALIPLVPCLPDTLPERSGIRLGQGWGKLLAKPEVRTALAAIFGLEAAVGIVAGFLRTVLTGPSGPVGELGHVAVTTQSGLLFSLFGVVAIGVMLSPWAGRVDGQGPWRPCLAGLASVGAALAVLWNGHASWAWAAMALYGVGYGLIFPAAAGVIAIAAAKEERGRGNGLFNFFFDLG
ncbi:MAG: MFS transporter, partial [Alphaproteobacteria bacterium]|nr:MFS transporter [Alphaproteobacteria bacterium]